MFDEQNSVVADEIRASNTAIASTRSGSERRPLAFEFPHGPSSRNRESTIAVLRGLTSTSRRRGCPMACGVIRGKAHDNLVRVVGSRQLGREL